MRLPTRVPNAMYAPGCCMCCGTNEGEMIDTGVDSPDGVAYICVRYCAPRIAALVGGQGPERQCTAIKQNGNRCTAKALPERELCVAHVRVEQRKEKEESDALVGV